MARLIVVLLITGLLSAPALASEQSHREAVIHLLELTKIKRMVDQLRPRLDSQFENVVSEMKFPDDQQSREDAFRQELNTLMSDALSWEQMQNKFVTIYMNRFEESEVKELNRFYSTAVGQKTIAQMPLIMKESLQYTQDTVSGLTPQVQQLINTYKAVE